MEVNISGFNDLTTSEVLNLVSRFSTASGSQLSWRLLYNQIPRARSSGDHIQTQCFCKFYFCTFFSSKSNQNVVKPENRTAPKQLSPEN